MGSSSGASRWRAHLREMARNHSFSSVALTTPIWSLEAARDRAMKLRFILDQGDPSELPRNEIRSRLSSTLFGTGRFIVPYQTVAFHFPQLPHWYRSLAFRFP
jgi:hypothetical protein